MKRCRAMLYVLLIPPLSEGDGGMLEGILLSVYTCGVNRPEAETYHLVNVFDVGNF